MKILTNNPFEWKLTRKPGKRRDKASHTKRLSPSLASSPTPDQSIAKIPSKRPVIPPVVCINPARRRSITSATSFASYVHTPLPTDQTLLTLLHFNMIRGFAQNVLLLGIDPDEMVLDIISPWVIIAGTSVDDVELRADVLYGVDTEGMRSNESCTESGRTGLIVWSDPWLQSSWEVDESFAKKWRRLLIGCPEILKSANYWRARRGEKPLQMKL